MFHDRPKSGQQYLLSDRKGAHNVICQAGKGPTAGRSPSVCIKSAALTCIETHHIRERERERERIEGEEGEGGDIYIYG